MNGRDTKHLFKQSSELLFTAELRPSPPGCSSVCLTMDLPHRTRANPVSVIKSYDPEFHSPNDMVIDAPEELGSIESEKEQVVDINPDSLDNGTDTRENVVLATDRTFRDGAARHNLYETYTDEAADEAMRELVLPPLLEEPRILEDVVSTWTIENWRAFQSKKEHGPRFQAGGFPW